MSLSSGFPFKSAFKLAPKLSFCEESSLNNVFVFDLFSSIYCNVIDTALSCKDKDIIMVNKDCCIHHEQSIMEGPVCGIQGPSVVVVHKDLDSHEPRYFSGSGRHSPAY